MSRTTLEILKLKVESKYGDNVKMPSIKKISQLLAAYGIPHHVSKITNVVEHRSKGKMYVNSRHMGKKGLVLKIDMGEHPNIELDTSSSYYSFNTWNYAKDILKLINSKQTSNETI